MLVEVTYVAVPCRNLTTFEVLICALTCQVFMSLFSAVNMSLAFNGSSAIQTLMHNRIMFNFYLGLPHMQCTYIVLKLVLQDVEYMELHLLLCCVLSSDDVGSGDT